MPRKRRRRRKRGRRGRLGWWLGFGAVGLAGAALLRRGRRAPDAAPASAGAEWAGSPDGADPCALPQDVRISWIPGPAGSLRLAERRPAGEDRPPIGVVYVHGLGGGLEHWATQLAALGPALHGVAVDLPGHGGSDPAADGDYSVAALGAAIGAAVDGLGLRRPVLVGHSLGALAAIDYAGRHPGRVAGLLLVDPAGDQTQRPEEVRRTTRRTLAADPRGETEWSFRHFLAGARPRIADRVMESLAAVADETLRGALEGSLDYPPLPALERFTGPVRLVVSELNRSPGSLHQLRPELPVRRLAGASHWLMMDRPEAVWAELIELLDELRHNGR